MDSKPSLSFSGRYFAHLLKKTADTQAPQNLTSKQNRNLSSSANLGANHSMIGESTVASSDSETESLSVSHSIHCSRKSTARVNWEVNERVVQIKSQTRKRRAETDCRAVKCWEEKRLKVDLPSDNVYFTSDEIQSLFEADMLSQQIRQYFIENQQQEWFLQKKCELTAALENILNRSDIMKCQIFIVGSSINGFGRYNSDCDMCLVVDKCSTNLNNLRVMRILSEIRRLLRHASFVRNLQLIPAKVRILKFLDCQSNIECDLNVNNLTGLRNTQLMYAYSRQDPRVQPLVLCIKEWAHENKINDASQGTLSSYALVLMVIHYLQCAVKPCVLPSLQMKYPSYFSDTLPIDCIKNRARSVPFVRSRNRNSLSELLIGFFRYFASFDFKKVISIRRAECFSVRGNVVSGPWYRKAIRIEEPFDLSNVARAVQPDKFTRISRCFDLAKTNLHPNGKLQQLIRVTKRHRHSLIDRRRPHF